MFSENIQYMFLGISTVLVVISMVRYIYSIIHGTTKPNLIGWALYQIATICVLLSAIDLKSLPTIALAATFSISQFIVIVLSFRYGYIKFSKIEGLLFAISLICFMLWIFVRYNPAYLDMIHFSRHDADIILLTVNTFIEVMGAIAIFIKLYHHPGTEDSASWLLGWVSGVFALLAVSAITYENILYPLYLVITNCAIWLLCFRNSPRWRSRWLMQIMKKFSCESRTGLCFEITDEK